jgi:hypothetical protein
MIAEFGERAGWVIGVAARTTQEPERRRRLLALIEEIERVAGFGWVVNRRRIGTRNPSSPDSWIHKGGLAAPAVSSIAKRNTACG